jgi:hypothetical protein
MKREFHVRFCERLEGETPSCLLSGPCVFAVNGFCCAFSPQGRGERKGSQGIIRGLGLKKSKHNLNCSTPSGFTIELKFCMNLISQLPA